MIADTAYRKAQRSHKKTQDQLDGLGFEYALSHWLYYWKDCEFKLRIDPYNREWWIVTCEQLKLGEYDYKIHVNTPLLDMREELRERAERNRLYDWLPEDK